MSKAAAHRIWYLGLLASLCAVCITGSGLAFELERVAAVVNRQVILLSEVKRRVAPFAAQLASVPDEKTRKSRLEEAFDQALDQLIDEKLVIAEASKLKLKVREKDLERALSEVMTRNNLTREQFEEALAQEGKTVIQYREEILRPQLLRLQVINQQVRSRISITDVELRELYRRNMRELGAETQIRVRQILIAVQEGPQAERAQWDDGKKRAMMVYQALQSGEKFEKLAEKHSDDEISKSRGGDLGYFGRGTLPPSVEDLAFEMKNGEVAGPIKSANGFHIIQMINRRDSAAKPFNEVKQQLYQQLYQNKLEKATRLWLKEVRKRTFIDKKM